MGSDLINGDPAPAISGLIANVSNSKGSSKVNSSGESCCGLWLSWCVSKGGKVVNDVGAVQARPLVARSFSEMGKAHDCHKPGPWPRGSNEHVIGR